ncbi:hypothetical protein [Nannocystis pusilla]|uniref:hypothetical protein n=1 Tax=Nannocystis pusilla TaxID=889268 RepID=UPI003BF38015
MSQRISVKLVGTLTDDENWPWNDETAPVGASGSDVVGSPGQSISLINIDYPCAGDEVRLVVQITGTLLGDGATIQIAATFTLFEGTDCTTSDPEGEPLSITRDVPNLDFATVPVFVPGDGGGSFRGDLTIVNFPVM